MRKPVALLGLVALCGAVLGAVGVLVSYWWSSREGSSRVTYFGTYVPGRGVDMGSPRGFVDYLPTSSTQSTDWAALLLPAVVGGAVGAVLLTALGWFAYRRLAR